MLSEFIAAEVEFLVVGGYAFAAHYEPRGTKDIDLWVRPDPTNAKRVYRALARFGAPLTGVEAGDFERPGLVFQVGLPPNRIDIMTSIKGVDFDEAWKTRIQSEIEGFATPVIGRAALIANKRATGRLQDKADVQKLERLEAPKTQQPPPRPRRKRR